MLRIVNGFFRTRVAGADTLIKPTNTAQKKNATRSAFLSVRSKGPNSVNGNIVLLALMPYANSEPAASQRLLSIARKLFYIFPVPGFVEVRTKTKALGIMDQPSICGSVDLDRAIRVFGIDGTAPDV